jgi:hypothetical protein
MQQFVSMSLPLEIHPHGLHVLTMLSSFTPTNFMDCMGMFFAMVVPIAPA